MFLSYHYETKTLTNTIEQMVISDHVISPLENQTIDNMIDTAVPLIFNFDFPFALRLLMVSKIAELTELT